ncbi:MAG: PEP-CTERM sorting domain-containing protein [Rhodospirillaceae bacterium]|nr:PEP-CTERM sorting domain-containing protein [Rhodospirillaceae bacterium]
MFGFRRGISRLSLISTTAITAIIATSPAMAGIIEVGSVNPTVASAGNTTIPGVLNIGSGGAMGSVTVDNNSQLTTGTGLGPGIPSTNVGLGAGSNGTLTIETGGDLISTNGIGVGIGSSTGTIDVNGAGSSVAAGDATFLGTGAGGSGSMTVRNGATASSDSVVMGQDTGSIGVLRVQNASSYMSTNPLISLDVGRAGDGMLEVSGASTFSISNNTAFDGSMAGGSGDVTVTGTSSKLEGTAIRFFEIGRAGGTGQVNVLDNAVMNIENSTSGSTGDVFFRVGASTGMGATPSGTLKVNGGGTVDIQSTNAGGDDAFLFISDPLGTTDALPGRVIVGDDPDTIGTVETGGTLNVLSKNDDAQIAVGLEGPGVLQVTDSVVTITSQGPQTGDSAILQIGGRSGPNNTATSKGEVTITNSTVTIDAQGAGSSITSVGRGTAAATTAAAPENTLIIQGGSTFNNITTGTGNATFNVGRSGTRGTVTVDGATTTLKVEDFVRIGRDGALGTMNVQNGGTVNNNTSANLLDDGVTRVGENGGTGTLDINTGGKYFAKVVENGLTGTGTIRVASGGNLSATTIHNGANGTLTGGGGSINATVNNMGSGTIAAGDSPGLMEIFGNLNLNGMGTVEIELGGTVFDTGIMQFDYDRIVVADDMATLPTEGIVVIDPDAIFEVSLFNMFTVSAGDMFDVLVADDIQGDLLLADFLLPILTGGLTWNTEIVSLQSGEALRLSVVGQVSEPGTLLVLLGGLSGLVILRRRRKQA